MGQVIMVGNWGCWATRARSGCNGEVNWFGGDVKARHGRLR